MNKRLEPCEKHNKSHNNSNRITYKTCFTIYTQAIYILKKPVNMFKVSKTNKSSV